MFNVINRSVLSVDRAAQSIDPLITQHRLHAGDILWRGNYWRDVMAFPDIIKQENIKEIWIKIVFWHKSFKTFEKKP